MGILVRVVLGKMLLVPKHTAEKRVTFAETVEGHGDSGGNGSDRETTESNPTLQASLVNQTTPFPSAGCIASPARGREGLGTLARFSWHRGMSLR